MCRSPKSASVSGGPYNEDSNVLKVKKGMSTFFSENFLMQAHDTT